MGCLGSLLIFAGLFLSALALSEPDPLPEELSALVFAGACSSSA